MFINFDSGGTSGAEVPPESKLMNIAQAAEALNLDKRSVRLACQERRLPAFKDLAGQWSMAEVDVLTYKERNK